MTVGTKRVLALGLALLMVASLPAVTAQPAPAEAPADAGELSTGSATTVDTVLAQADADDGPQNLDLEVESVTGTAGGAGAPSTVNVFVSVEQDGAAYDEAISADDLNVTVGDEDVDQDTVTTSLVRPGYYLLSFGTPEQDSAGDYDMTVEFGDAEVTKSDAIIYSAVETSVIAASLQIDTSGSMNGIMQEARRGGLAFVEQGSDDSHVAVVPYDSSAWEAQELVQLEDNRDDVRSAIEGLGSSGGTNIHDAMETGLGSLEDAPDGTVRAGLLLSDGQIEDSQKTDILDQTVPKYNDRGICLYTIGFTNDVDEAFMQQLANEVDCGFYEFAAESGEIDAVDQTLQRVFEDMQRDVSDDSTLSDDSGSVPANQGTQGSYSVDESVTQTTVNIRFEGVDLNPASVQSLSVTPLATDSNAVTLYDPDGNEVDQNDSDVEVSVLDDTVIYRIDDPTAGEWTYELQNPDDTEREYSATVTGFAQANLELVTNADTYYEGGQTNVIVTLNSQEHPIEGASVEGEVTAPDGSVENVTLTETTAGVYTVDVDVDQSGTYELTALATKDDLSRADTLEWEVHEGEPISFVQAGRSAVDQGDTDTVDVTLERAADGGSAQEVVVGVGTLEQVDGSGTVDGDQLSVQNQSVELGPGENATVSLGVDAARDLPYGTYTSTVQAYLEDGSVVDGSVNATIEIDREPADYTGASSTVDVDGLLDAVDEFRNGVIDVDHLLDVIDAFATDANVD